MNAIEKAAKVLREAEIILIGAGAGMSAAAGLDYTDDESFAVKFPGMLQYGVRNQYQLMGYPFKDEALKWGYLAAAMDYVYKASPTPVYQNLRKLIGDRNYFVMTSNVDRYFHKNGFDEERIFTPQGDYELFQCFTPCTGQVWDAKHPVELMLPHINRATQIVENTAVLPTCPNCGGPVFMNVRGGGWFIEHPYEAGSNKLNDWLQKVRDKKIAVLEIGAGFNTPGVIRMPMETICSRFPNATLIRINRDHSSGPEGTISISEPADAVINTLCNL